MLSYIPILYSRGSLVSWKGLFLCIFRCIGGPPLEEKAQLYRRKRNSSVGSCFGGGRSKMGFYFREKKKQIKKRLEREGVLKKKGVSLCEGKREAFWEGKDPYGREGKRSA